jgi:hypothetical protein
MYGAWTALKLTEESREVSLRCNVRDSVSTTSQAPPVVPGHKVRTGIGAGTDTGL